MSCCNCRRSDGGIGSRYLESTDVFTFEALEAVKKRLDVVYMYPRSPEMQKEFIKKHWGIRVDGYRAKTQADIDHDNNPDLLRQYQRGYMYPVNYAKLLDETSEHGLIPGKNYHDEWYEGYD